MRKGRGFALPSVLGLSFAWLLMLPLAAAAASGLPATIAINPPDAGPGDRVEVVGLDFPPQQQVQLQVTTTAGAVQLGTATTADGGYFRQAVTFPSDVAAGFWELRATAPDGTVAVQIFEAGAVAAEAAAVPAEAVAPEAASGSSIFNANTLVVLVIAGLIAAVGGAGAFVWYQLHRKPEQDGMSAGEDPIWGGVSSDTYGR